MRTRVPARVHAALSRLPHRHSRRPPSRDPTTAGLPDPGNTAVQLPCDDSELCPTPPGSRLPALVNTGEVRRAVLTLLVTRATGPRSIAIGDLVQAEWLR
ncbi:hypothetical protein CEB94_25125 [Streptomyces hawaiiensis]|uniref:Uncharacterized protein n=1 Tax=Streptomyces hawaiiensis TaxID=67305 RepID=A0A6G5RIS4_9ACTN|nr:hypothetical protein CEB94_25125 [Streptomyces hawaiiensis]